MADHDCPQPHGNLSLQTIAMPKDTNWNGDIFGGWLVSQMDLAGATAARRRSHGRITTVAIDSMTFLHPVQTGDVISCYTSIEHIGRTSMKIRIEVWETGDPCRDPVKLTEGLFTFVAIDEAGKPRPVPTEGCGVNEGHAGDAPSATDDFMAERQQPGMQIRDGL